MDNLTDVERSSYTDISSVESLPTMCNTASLPPGCLSSHPSSCNTLPSLITIMCPFAMRPSTSRREKVLLRSTGMTESNGEERGKDSVEVSKCRSEARESEDEGEDSGFTGNDFHKGEIGGLGRCAWRSNKDAHHQHGRMLRSYLLLCT